MLVIVIVLFGAERIAKIASELGNGIRSFREAVQDDRKADLKYLPKYLEYRKFDETIAC